tara:strand:+ start:7982 stop:8599 length:618 start_codon:yes stop_codon:yes gene_type:complete
MPSKTDIVNMAASFLGQPPIASMDSDRGPMGETARATYTLMLDAVLRGFTWNFAIQRRSATSVGTPEWGWNYMYNLADDELRVLSLESDDINDWVVEGRKILTDLGSPINYKVIVRVTDTSQYDSLFIEAFARRLAMNWAERILKSTTAAREQSKLYAELMREARSVDSTEKTPEVIEADEWIDSRGKRATRRAVLSGDPQALGY